MLQTALLRLKRAVNLPRWAVWPLHRDVSRPIRTLCDWSRLSRKEGLQALENLLESQKDPFAPAALHPGDDLFWCSR